jgi:hypothetical protein
MNTFDKAAELVEQNMSTKERTKLYVVGITFSSLAIAAIMMIAIKIIRK